MTAQGLETDVRELVLSDGLIGFPDARRFALVQWGDDDDTPFSILQSLDDTELSFVVVPPDVFFPDYAPEIDDVTAARLELAEPTDALVLSIVTVADRPQDCTANLLGPIVVNLRTLNAAQVVLESGHSARCPLGTR